MNDAMSFIGVVKRIEETYRHVDEGSEVAAATIDLADGVPHEAATQTTFASIADLAIQATTFLCSVATPEAIAALELIRASMGG